MLKKILWSVIIIAFSITASFGAFDFIFNIRDLDWKQFETWLDLIIWLVFVWMPLWFAWKGTKLIPIIMILPIRLFLLILGLFFPIILAIFGLWGIWVKS